MTELTFYPSTTASDAVLTFFGHDPYIETFWLRCLGPTATLLASELSFRALYEQERFVFDAAELSQCMGTGARDGHSAPILKQLIRLSRLHILEQVDEYSFSVPTTLPMLPAMLLAKLGSSHLSWHHEWIYRLVDEPVITQRRRALGLQSRLEAMGMSAQRIQSALYASGLHPSIIGEIVSRNISQDSSA